MPAKRSRRGPAVVVHRLRALLGRCEDRAVRDLVEQPFAVPSRTERGRFARLRRPAALAAALALGALPAFLPLAAAAEEEPGATEPIEVAIVAPLTAGAQPDGLIGEEALDELVGEEGRLTEEVAALRSLPVTFAVDPMIDASIEAAELDSDWARSLVGAGAGAFPLLYGDADPALLAAVGIGLPAAPDPLPRWVSSAWRAHPDAVLGSATINDEGPAVFTTLSALRADEAPDRPAVVVLGRAGVADAEVVATQIRALAADPRYRLVPLASLVDEVDGLLRGTLAEPDPTRVSSLTQLATAHAATVRFATVAEDPSRVTSGGERRIYALASVAWESADDWSDAVGEALVKEAATQSSVQISVSDSFFFADRSNVPIAVSNALDQPVTVVVAARADSARLSLEDGPITVTIPAGTQTTVEFPAVAVSNGKVRITATVASAEGHPVGSLASATITVQAGWETPIVAVIAALVIAVAVLGVVRTIVRVRRRPAPAAAADPPAGDADTNESQGRHG